MKKSRSLACHVINSDSAINSMPTVKIALGIVALFEKIYHGDPILTVFSVIREEVQDRRFSSVYDVKSILQPDVMT